LPSVSSDVTSALQRIVRLRRCIAGWIYARVELNFRRKADVFQLVRLVTQAW
jgi:hypothetical protein